VIYSLGDCQPTLEGGNHFIAPNAAVIGSVTLADSVSVWFSAVLRGDLEYIRVGADTNVQDGAVLHTDHDAPCIVGRGVTIGHTAMLHGCTVGDWSLVGMHAVVLTGATVGRNCIVGANALVPEGREIPDRSLVLGSPAKVKRELTDEDIAMIHARAAWYVETAKRYNVECEALLQG
jgi:carbonic anhydrase/acetyltransferase-like protein (isoleucine patch superfamily)